MATLDTEKVSKPAEERAENSEGDRQRNGEEASSFSPIVAKAKAGMNNFVDFCKNLIGPQGPGGYIRRNSIFASAPPPIFVEDEPKWKTNLKQIWAKDFSQLPVSSDLPRLIYFISIDDNGEEKPKPTDTPQDVLVQEFLSRLARLLENEELAQTVKDTYSQYITGENLQTGVFARQFSKYVAEVLGTGSIVRVLKTCHQNIIAPCIIELKLNICPSLIFKDAGGWKIRISVRDDAVIVTHRKKQKDFGNPSLWAFEWLLRIEFPRSLDSISALSLNISELTFSPEILPEKKLEIEKMFEAYLLS